MHIHKPKLPHGWRDFIKEYGIIVLGVITALSAEQAVEAAHHREMVARGEEALADNFARFVQFKAEVDQEAPCMAARAAELKAILDDAGKTRRLGGIKVIPQPYPLPWQIDTWEAMVASGAAPYLPTAKTVHYSRIAMSAVDLYKVATDEWQEWGALSSLAGPPRPFSEAEEAQARENLARALENARLVRFFADHTLDRIAQTRLLDQTALDAAAERGRHPAHPVAMCQPIVVEPPS